MAKKYRTIYFAQDSYNGDKDQIRYEQNNYKAPLLCKSYFLFLRLKFSLYITGHIQC